MNVSDLRAALNGCASGGDVRVVAPQHLQKADFLRVKEVVGPYPDGSVYLMLS